MYRLAEYGVVRLSDGASIPADARNMDWLAYTAWREGGGAPISGAAVPVVVTRKQALLALLAADKLDAVDLFISQAPRAVQIAWDAAGTFERTNPLIQAIAPQVGLTPSDIDDLFIEAAKL